MAILGKQSLFDGTGHPQRNTGLHSSSDMAYCARTTTSGQALKVSRDKRITEINAYYARRARWHDGYLSYRSNETMEARLGPIIRLVEPFIEGRDLLEVACGTGIWTQVLAKRAKTVTATDVNESMIDQARLKPYEKSQPAFVVCDAYRLDKLDGQFDGAFMSDFWSHVPKQLVAGFLQQLHRKLRPDGCVVAVDMSARPDSEGSVVRFDDHGNRMHRRTLPDGSHFEIVKNYYDYRTLSEQSADLTDEIHYWQDEELLRWALAYQPRNQPDR